MPAAKEGARVPKSASALFESLGVTHRVAQYRRSAVVFAQGADCAEVMYLLQGSGITVRPTLLSVVLHS
jgi:hypothetical protein